MAAILCVSKKIRRKLKVGVEQKLRESEGDEKETGSGRDREETKNLEINIFCIITYSFLGC